MAAQAFLFTIELGGGISRFSRATAAFLSVLMSLLSMHLMARQRQAEVTDAHWLAGYEQRR